MVHALITLDPEQITTDLPDIALPAWIAQLVACTRQAASSGQTVTLSAAERMLSPEQFGRRMGMHRSTVVRKIEAGEIQGVLVGSHHKVPYSEFLRYRRSCLENMAKAVAPDIKAELFGDA